MYREECVKQSLVPFLEEHHADGDYLFWPDYAIETQDLFNKLEISFIPHGSNLHNSPQYRPFERFFGILKAKVYDRGWKAKTFRMLRQRIWKTLMEIDISLCQNLFTIFKTMIRIAADKGLIVLM